MIGGESDKGSSGLMSALGWGVALAATGTAMAAASLRNSARTALVLAAALPAAWIGTGLAVVLVPLPGGVGELCACGAVMIACGAAGLSLFAGRDAGYMNAPLWPGTLTGPLEELFGCWVLLIAALAPFALVPLAMDVPVAFHASAFALVCSVGTTAGYLLVPLTLPAWVLARS
jgi:hypothetical protein